MSAAPGGVCATLRLCACICVRASLHCVARHVLNAGGPAQDYLGGNWVAARTALEQAAAVLPGDGPTQTLLKVNTPPPRVPAVSCTRARCAPVLMHACTGHRGCRRRSARGLGWLQTPDREVAKALSVAPYSVHTHIHAHRVTSVQRNLIYHVPCTMHCESTRIASVRCA